MKKIATYLIIIINLAFCLVGIYYLNKDDYGIIDNNSDILSISEDINNSVELISSITSVGLGTVTETFTANAKVCSTIDGIYTTTNIDVNKQEKGWKKNIGDIVYKNEVIFNNKSYSFKSPIKGKIINIEDNSNGSTITFIDYSKLYLKADIKSKNVNDIKYLSEATFEVNENIMSAKLFYTSGVISDENTMDAYLNYTDENMWIIPGMEVKLIFKSKEVNDVLYLPLDYVYEKNNKYYVYKKSKDDKYDKVDIEIGLIGKDAVEIKSQLKENDIVYQIYTDEKNLLSSKIGEIEDEK